MATEPNTARQRLTLDCIVCGAAFSFDKPRSGRYPRFCSPECKAKRLVEIGRQSRGRLAQGIRRNRYPKGVKRTPSPRYEFTCEHCGKAYLAPKASGGNRFCSRRCLDGWHVGQATALVQARLVERCCPACGKAFRQAIPRQRYCSTACRKKLDWSERTHRRRALVGAGEPVSPEIVFKRDGWRCQMCGVATPKHLRGTTNRRAPELDHIVPLSKGGEHSYRNTQCACRACNLSKGSSLKGQLRLFG